MSDANFDKVEALEAWAAERGHTILELAFAWLLGHEAVSSVIASTTSAEQVRTNAATAGWRLTPEEVTEGSKLWSGTDSAKSSRAIVAPSVPACVQRR